MDFMEFLLSTLQYTHNQLVDHNNRREETTTTQIWNKIVNQSSFYVKQFSYSIFKKKNSNQNRKKKKITELYTIETLASIRFEKKNKILLLLLAEHNRIGLGFLLLSFSILFKSFASQIIGWNGYFRFFFSFCRLQIIVRISLSEFCDHYEFETVLGTLLICLSLKRKEIESMRWERERDRSRRKRRKK